MKDYDRHVAHRKECLPECVKFQAYEVSLVGEWTGDSCEVIHDIHAELHRPFDRTFWSIYGWRLGHGVEWLGDYTSKEHACEMLSLILGVPISFEGTTESFNLQGGKF